MLLCYYQPFVLAWSIFFKNLCKTSLMVMNSFTFCLFTQVLLLFLIWRTFFLGGVLWLAGGFLSSVWLFMPLPSGLQHFCSVIWWLPFEVKWSDVAQSHPTLCDPMDCSLLGSSVHGILQARILEWVAIWGSHICSSLVAFKNLSLSLYFENLSIICFSRGLLIHLIWIYLSFLNLDIPYFLHIR